MPDRYAAAFIAADALLAARSTPAKSPRMAFKAYVSRSIS